MPLAQLAHRFTRALIAVREEHGLTDSHIGRALWRLRRGDAMLAPFDVEGPARDALVRWFWLLLIRWPVQVRGGLTASLLCVELMAAGESSMAEVAARVEAQLLGAPPFVRGERLPPTWTHSANAWRDVARRGGDDLLLLALRPIGDAERASCARVAALEARACARLRSYLDGGDPRETIAPDLPEDRAWWGLHLAWWGDVLPGVQAIEHAIAAGFDRAMGLRLCADALQEGAEHARAVDVLCAFIVLRPEVGLWCRLASSLSALSRHDEALAALAAGISCDPGASEPFAQRATLRRLRGDLSGARADLERATALAPSRVAHQVALAGVEAEDGLHERAIARASLALRLDPGRADALHLRGASRFACDDAEGALEDFRRALSLDPQPAIRQDEARALARLGRAACAFDPGDGAAWIGRAEARASTPWPALLDALVGFDLLEPDDPGRAQAALLVQGLVACVAAGEAVAPSRLELERAAAALADYGSDAGVTDLFAFLEPLLEGRADFWALRGRMGARVGIRAARDWLAHALEIDPDCGYALYASAITLLEDDAEGAGPRAARLLERALARVGEADWQMVARYHLGDQHGRCGRWRAAVDVLEEALGGVDHPCHLDPDAAKALGARVAFRLGDAYVALGDDAGALGAYDRGLALDRAMATLWLRRARLRARRGAIDAARDDLDQALERDPEARTLASLDPVLANLMDGSMLPGNQVDDPPWQVGVARQGQASAGAW